MRGFLAVARREIEEKRFVFAAAAVASLVPFAIPLVRGMHGANAAEARDWTAVLLAMTFGAGLALGLGSTTIATDLAERRIGFYFSRPISGLALWAGKLGTACLIALAAAAIVYAPTLAFNHGSVMLIDLPRQSPLIFAAGVAATVLLMHAGNIALRPRSPLLALDIAALVVLSLAAVFLVQRFLRAFAMEPLRIASNGLLVVTALALLAAGLLAVTRGRSDSRAAHRTLSATLWSILGAGVLATAGYAAWVFAVSPRDLTQIDWVAAADRGSWVKLQGVARGWEPVFLFNTATGKFQKTGGNWVTPALSPDGTRAASFERAGQSDPVDVITWRLDQAASKPDRTALSLPGFPAHSFLSDHGEKLATISGGALSVWDPATGASLGSARIGAERSYPRGFFLDQNRLRVFRPENMGGPSKEGRVDILEFDVSTKTLTTTGAIDGTDGIAYSASPSGDRLLVREKSRLTLHDGRTGTLIASLMDRGPIRMALGRFLSDGRIAIAVAEGSGSDASRARQRLRSVRLEIFTKDGRPERTVPIPAHEHVALGGEVAPGRLVVAAGGDSDDRTHRTIFLVDLSTGEIRKVADRLFPISYFWWYSNINYRPEPGSEGTKLFYGPDGSLVHFDALTGERRVILGKTPDR